MLEMNAILTKRVASIRIMSRRGVYKSMEHARQSVRCKLLQVAAVAGARRAFKRGLGGLAGHQVHRQQHGRVEVAGQLGVEADAAVAPPVDDHQVLPLLVLVQLVVAQLHQLL